MGEVTGPISTLPGHSHELPEGAVCDWHTDRPAVARIQGETDSFGSEMYDMCRECLDEHCEQIRSAEARTGRCDWCKKDATDLVWARCYDEGLDGPTYHVCGACKERQTRRLQQEMDEHDLDYPEDDNWDDDPWDPSDECGMTDSGTCTNAGTEWCDFECPRNRHAVQPPLKPE